MRYFILVVIMVGMTACSIDMNDKTNEDMNNNIVNEDLSFREEFQQSLQDDARSTVELDEEIINFHEYQTIQDIVQLENHSFEIMEDSVGKRILLIKDQHNDEVYKTIYTKKNHRLKIIEIEKGQIFNKIIS